MATKIYISGKISGIENEAPELFAKAETELQAKGFETVNPITLNHQHDKSWHSYMREDVKALCECDTIYMLSNCLKTNLNNSIALACVMGGSSILTLV